MNGIDRIINVNPALQPAGATNPDVALGAIRSRVAAQGTDMVRRQSGSLLRRLFGPTSLKPALSVAMLIIRIVFGSWCLWQGSVALLSGTLSGMDIMLLISGVMIGLGLFTRVISSASMLICTYFICNALSQGNLLSAADLYTLIFAIFAMIGPGRYSFDSILRRNIFRSLRRRQIRQLLENRFSYRAFEFAQY